MLDQVKLRGHMASPPASTTRNFADTMITLATILPLAVKTLAVFLLRRLTTAMDLSVSEDFQLSMMRNLDSIPESMKHRLLKSDPQSIIDSARFRNVKSRLAIGVSRPEFEGVWLYKSPETESSRMHIVLFWIHGGAYTLGDPFMGYVLLLRVVELAAEQDISLSVFSLDYTLAPHAQFPQQQQEALAAYSYLIEDQGIDPGSILIGGESAGAHVVLTALVAINDACMPKPRAALLLYPWVNLKNAGGSFSRNQYKDILSKTSLDRSVKLAIGPEGEEKNASLVDFASPLLAGRNWVQILPNVTRVNIGSHDMLVDDASLFVNNAKKDGAIIHLEVSPGKTHGWQLMDNRPNEKAYCALSPEGQVSNGFLLGSENVAKHFFEIIKSINN